MSHLEPEQLALLAIGEPVASPEELAHLSSCAQCARDLAEMTRTVTIARSTLGDDALETPPEHVWASVVAELELSGSADAAADDESEVAGRSTGSSAEAVERVATPPRSRRRRTVRTVWALAASVLLVAGVALGSWAIAVRLAPTSIAEATLDAFPTHQGAVGTADVEQGRDGSRTLVVTLDSSKVPHTYREVWLIRNDAGALISLGVLAGDRGTFPIPQGVDLDKYSLVDISAEPLDGNPAHSGDSIVRGKLGFV